MSMEHRKKSLLVSAVVMLLCMAVVALLLRGSPPQPPGPVAGRASLHIVTRPNVQLPEMTWRQYSPDGAWLTFVVTQRQETTTRALVSIELDRFQLKVSPLTGSTIAPLFSPAGQLLAICSTPDTVSLWQLPAKLRDLPLPTVNPSKSSPSRPMHAGLGSCR